MQRSRQQAEMKTPLAPTASPPLSMCANLQTTPTLARYAGFWRLFLHCRRSGCPGSNALFFVHLQLCRRHIC